MADTDWNLHSKQLITPTDNDRMLVEPSDETAKAVEVGGFRNWLMSTALFNTLTTTAKTIIGAIEEIKGKVEDNTTSLNEITNKISAIRFFSVVVDPNGQNSVNVVLSDIKSSSIILAINGDYTAAVEYVVGIKVNDGSLVVYLNTARTGSMRISGIYSI